MGSGGRIILVLATSACGRFAFDPLATGDAGGVLGDGTTDAPAYVCPARFALCDPFETAALDPAWEAFGVVTHDTSTAHRGTGSLRFSMAATQPGTLNGIYLLHRSSLISAAAQLWVRGWYRMSPSGIPLSTNALEILSVGQSGGLGEYVFLRAANTQLYSQFDMSSAGNNTPVPIDTWFCLVWHLTFSTTGTGTMSLTSDVLPPVTITSADTQGSPPVDYLAIGPYFSSTNADVMQPPFDLWVDDVIVDATQAITCAD